MNPRTKNLILFITLVVIGFVIWYIQLTKPAQVNVGGKEIILPNDSLSIDDTNATTTSEIGSSTPKTANQVNNSSASHDRTEIRAAKAKLYPRAKELEAIAGYINTPEFKLADIVGKKVVLIDFWTYSCINCLRTLPYVTTWYDKYKDQGLVIVGVHTPEFDFEKDYKNVSNATVRLGVKYPVVLDSSYGTWNAYQNRYWPREYLIDIDGFISHDHIGEGSYDETERAIQAALKERNQALGIQTAVSSGIIAPKDAVNMNGNVASPETYFGAARNEYLGNGKPSTSGSQTLILPATGKINTLYLSGTWNFTNQSAANTSKNAKIVYKYSAKNLYFVASSDAGVKISITRDGKPLGAEKGADVSADGTLLIKENRLYKLIEGTDYSEHTIEITIEKPGLNAYTFTFG